MEYFTQPQQVIHTIENALKSYKRFAQKNIKAIDTTITVDQASLLLLIRKHPDIPQSQLGTILFKDLAAITRMIDLMAKNKYIKRKENAYDRRRNTLQLTDKGEKTLKKLRPILKSNSEGALKNFGNYEIDRLDKLLERIVENCEE